MPVSLGERRLPQFPRLVLRDIVDYHAARTSTSRRAETSSTESDRPSISKASSNLAEKTDIDVRIVDWEGPDDPQNPKKWFDNPDRELVAFESFFFGPMSKIYGRSCVLRLANLRYLVLATTGSQTSVAKQSLSIPYHRLAICPATGARIAECTTWRWVFWSTDIADGVVQILGVLFLQEIYAPLLLKRKAKKIRQAIAQEKVSRREVRTVFEAQGRMYVQRIESSRDSTHACTTFRDILPWTHPAVLGVYMTYLYGMLYCVDTTGLHYIALGIDLIRTLARICTRPWIKFAFISRRSTAVSEAQFRLRWCLVLGWTSEAHAPCYLTEVRNAPGSQKLPSIPALVIERAPVRIASRWTLNKGWRAVGLIYETRTTPSLLADPTSFEKSR
ncbi:hypothetical protein BU15DRAFT_67138 [Melanogaster broomeanus]|nr:hypothetical protein BU15DRAFT_67138 [Melanogaster broomeanus]